MSDAGIFSSSPDSRPIPHVDLPVDPNLPGEGQRIRDLVEMERLDTATLAEIATRLDPTTLLRNARDTRLSDNGKFPVRRGNADVVALIEAGVFQFNEQALRTIVREISFTHPLSVAEVSDSGKGFVDALKKSNALEADSELPDVVLRRRDILSSASESQFLAEAIEADLFKGRPDLFASIIEKIEEARVDRSANPAYGEGNGYWEKAMRKIEQPVVNALQELGAPVRSLLDR